jgi:hypothetical protein
LIRSSGTERTQSMCGFAGSYAASFVSLFPP